MCKYRCVCLNARVSDILLKIERNIWKETNENSPIHMKVTSWLFTYLSNCQGNVLSGSDGNLLSNSILELVIEVVVIIIISSHISTEKCY